MSATGHTMTWGELKQLVEAAGITDEDGIFIIDIAYPFVNEDGATNVVVKPSEDDLGFEVY